MEHIKIKRIYLDPEESDGYRVFVDRLWPRGMSKDEVHYDVWDKDLAPSSELRKWFHEDPEKNWDGFRVRYLSELAESEHVTEFISGLRSHYTVTLLYAAKDPEHNHALILMEYIEMHA